MEKVSENPLKNRNAADTGHGTGRSALMAVTAVFVTLYLTSNIMAVKVISIFGMPVRLLSLLRICWEMSSLRYGATV